MAARALDAIECSVQPLDFAFHPSRDIIATGLVDGTIEFHDISSRLTQPSVLPYAKSTSSRSKNNDDIEKDDFDDDEDDTILSSIGVHSSDIPKYKITSALKSPESLSPSCRAVMFSTNGKYLYTVGNGGTLACLDVEKASHYSTSDLSLLWKIDNASPNGINVLYQLPECSPAGPLIVTGDDEGVVRLWDVSLLQSNNNENTKKTAFDGLLDLPRGCVGSFHEHTDYISGFETDDTGYTLLVTSADGTLSVIDLRKGSGNTSETNVKKGHKVSQKAPTVKSGKFNLIRKSDDQEDELLSVCVIKSGKKVLCGTQNGIINVWSWGTWGDISDRFPGHPQSIDAILKVDEDTVLTGSSDGVVRVVQIHPDQFLGIFGDHGGFPVEKLKFSQDKKIVGSASHDNSIRLWDSSILADEGVDGDEKDDCSMDEDNEIGKGATFASNSDDEWEDVDESDDDSDDSMDDSDDNSNDKKGSKRRFKTENEKFFEDL